LLHPGSIERKDLVETWNIQIPSGKFATRRFVAPLTRRDRIVFSNIRTGKGQVKRERQKHRVAEVVHGKLQNRIAVVAVLAERQA
jgi:hypothetical protein